MHLVVENRIANRAEIKLELHESQTRVSFPIALVEHGLFGIDGPAFDVGAGLQYATDEGTGAIRIFQLHIMAGIAFVNREDLEHMAIVLFEESFDAFGSPLCQWRANRVEARRFRVERRRGIEISKGVATLKFRHLDYLAMVRF